MESQTVKDALSGPNGHEWWKTIDDKYQALLNYMDPY